jgi:GxxExxY protein
MNPQSPERALANELSKRVIGAAIEVHRQLGPGLLESAYEACLCHELALHSIPFERQVPLPVLYKGLEIDCAYRLDLIVGGLVILELKAVEKFLPIFDAQLLTYLRLSQLWLGLLINFNVEMLKDGIKRLVNG